MSEKFVERRLFQKGALFSLFALFFISACASKQDALHSQRLEIGSAHLNLGHGQLAEQEFQAVLREDPSNWAAHYEMGRLESLRGNAHAAMDHFETVLKQQPYNASAHVGLGWTMIELHELQGAETHFNKAIELGDEEILALTGLGAARLHRHQPEEAKVFFDRALKMDPNYALTHYYLGEFFELKRDTQMAMEHYKQCTLRDNPKRADAYYKLACCYAELKHPEATLNALQQAARYGFKKFDLVVKDARFNPYRKEIDRISPNSRERGGKDKSGGDKGGHGHH